MKGELVSSLIRHLIVLYRRQQLRKLYNEFHSLATIGPFFETEIGACVKNESGERERIVLGHHCRVNGMLTCKAHGKLEVGNYTTIQDGVSIQCLNQISIGSYSGIAGGALITDNNTHPIGIENWVRHRIRVAPGGTGYPGLGNGWELSESAPVVIGDGVWVGSGSTILKGVTIGDGVIIARGSTVTKDVAPFTLVAGNPAKKVKDLIRPEKSVIEIAEAILGEGM